MSTSVLPDRSHQEKPNWMLLSIICGSYVAATIGEQVLGPIFPDALSEFGLSEVDGGIAFGLLAASIALMNLIGGLTLARVGARRTIALASLFSCLGAIIAATSHSFAQLATSQILLGAGAGLFFPAGLQMAGVAGGTSRRGFVMGIYGVAYSLGLTASAALGALGAQIGWRSAFAVSATLSLLALISTFFTKLPSIAKSTKSGREALRLSLSNPTLVGGIGTISQYGSISFMTTYAVQEWGISTAKAAAILGIGRVISIVAKLVSGSSSDRIGPFASARWTGIALFVTGIAWVTLPGGLLTYFCAAVFAGTVSSLGPIANMLAVEKFGRDGVTLGAFRSLQIAMGATAGILIGLFGELFGLRIILALAVFTPLSLLWVCREPKQ